MRRLPIGGPRRHVRWDAVGQVAAPRWLTTGGEAAQPAPTRPSHETQSLLLQICYVGVWWILVPGERSECSGWPDAVAHDLKGPRHSIAERCGGSAGGGVPQKHYKKNTRARPVQCP